jgi:hypothetical protein
MSIKFQNKLKSLIKTSAASDMLRPERKWLADFAWPKWGIRNGKAVCNLGMDHIDTGIMLEVNGGTYLQGNRRGAHSRGSRQRKDYEKWSAASILGWTVILVDSVDVKKGVHVERVLQAMGKA